MDTTNKNSAYNAEWLEREEHEAIMKALSGVFGETGSYFYINGNYHYWHINELPEGEPERIAKRGNHEEILYMIHQYGKTKCNDENYLRGYAWSSHHNESGAHLSDEVQRIILERNNPEEISAYLLYHGFAPAGQDFILERGNHTEIMMYLMRHGFAPEQQLKLWKRGNKEEIERHIKNHGCSEQILSEMFDGLCKGKGESRKQFLEHIQLHEFPVPFQIRMIREVGKELFMAYINQYGLWNDAHAELIRERDIDEITFYIDKHKFLSPAGERQLAYRHVSRLTMRYLEKRVNKNDVGILYELLDAKPIDRDALKLFFLTAEYSDACRFEDQCKLMKAGSEDEILAYINDNRLVTKALATLFFRDDINVFDAYVKRWHA